MSLTDLFLLLQTWGPVIGPSIVVLAFFLWKDHRREDRLQTRIEKLEEEQKSVMLPMIERCAEVIGRNTEVMARLEKLFERQSRLESQSERCVLEQLLEDAEKHRQDTP